MIYYRNWLMQLWRPRSPTVCLLQAGEWGKLVASAIIQSESGIIQSMNQDTNIWGQEKMEVLAQVKKVNSIFPQLFALFNPSRLSDTLPHGWGWISSLSLLNQILISLKNTLTDTSRVMFYIYLYLIINISYLGNH